MTFPRIIGRSLCGNGEEFEYKTISSMYLLRGDQGPIDTHSAK